MTVADNLKQAREQCDLSYAELSDLTGIAKSTLQRYETGTTSKIPLDAIEKISKALKVSPHALLGWQDENNDDHNKVIPFPKQNNKLGSPNIQNKLSDILSELRPDSGITLKNGEKTMTDSEKEILRISLENIIRLAKQMEK